ncbi:ribonuclease H-like domain-containing protein, partial [Armillaria novae-zelandiae]
YMDGSVVLCGTDRVMAGAGMYYGENDPRNRSICLPNKVGYTNQVSETVGVKTAAEDTPINNDLELVSNSRHVLNGLNGRFTKWEDEGYFLIGNSHVMETTIARFRAHTLLTKLRWVKGHSGDPENHGADCLA